VNDLRELIRAAVSSRSPVDAREQRSIDTFVAELDRLDRPFEEDADLVHVTASAIVTGPRGALLHRHKRLGIWLQPGGHIDAGEMPWDAAAREAVEETGVEVRFADDAAALIHIDVHPGPRGHTHLDLRYHLVAGDVDPAPPAGESQDVRWFGWDEAIAIADPGLLGALRSLRR
jgi:8-oxo-dGTP pyrophosphatase MutT (NUDIX family)